MPRPRPLLPVLGPLAAMLLLTGCGGEDAKLLPGETAREITANLDTVQQLSNEGDCIGAESAVEQVGAQIDALEGVDRKLKRALEEGATRLEEVIVECEESSSEAIAPATTAPESNDEEGEGEGERESAKEKEGKEKTKPREETTTEPSAPSLPPQANGEGKGLENGNGPPSNPGPPEEEAAPPSGGVSPGSPARGGE